VDGRAVVANFDLERLNLTGTGSVDGTGNSLDNIVKGNRSDNVLKGWSGDDIVRGEAGSDAIMGGSGKDSLYGGYHADTFIFRSLEEAGIWGERDVIRDFTRNYDAMDLSQIDANTGVAGNQSFRFIESDLFNKVAGELRQDGSGILRGDVDGDGTTDFQIELANGVALSETDFLLYSLGAGPGGCSAAACFLALPQLDDNRLEEAATADTSQSCS
jgi:Ca2+-binding RTX toxin-like protein